MLWHVSSLQFKMFYLFSCVYAYAHQAGVGRLEDQLWERVSVLFPVVGSGD